MTEQQDMHFLRRAIQIAADARAHGNHPFGALLVDCAGGVLLEAENSVVTERDCTNHAETNLVRLASRRFDQETLAGATLYTSTEPCAMCSGAIFWSGIGRVVYALSEQRLLQVASSETDEDYFFLPCREVFSHGRRAIDVAGPLIEDEAEAVHRGFWK